MSEKIDHNFIIINLIVRIFNNKLIIGVQNSVKTDGENYKTFSKYALLCPLLLRRI